MELPAELRNQIYGYIVVRGEPIDISEINKVTPPLPSARKMIREEAIKISIAEPSSSVVCGCRTSMTTAVRFSRSVVYRLSALYCGYLWKS